MRHYIRQRASLVRALTLALVTSIAALANAGPPLLCPPTTLDTTEHQELARLCDSKTAIGDATRELVALLRDRTSGRFHVEALRAFWHARRPEMPAVIEALESAAKQKDTNTDRMRFALALARVLNGFDSADSWTWATDLARAADRTLDPAHSLATAEAIDLISDQQGAKSRPLLAHLSLHYFERAIEQAVANRSPDATLCRRMIVDHTPFMKGMHGPAWDWTALDAKIESLGGGS